MEWTTEADEAVKKVPFFVRKKVRLRVEEYTTAAGKKVVSLADVKTAQARFLSKMSEEIKGYQVEACFGAGGCPNRVGRSEDLLERIENRLAREDLLSFLKQRVKGELKFHHEFRVAIADCPNACSQPQIKDIGIIGASLPEITDEDCTLCSACVEVCPDRCVTLNMVDEVPDIDMHRCPACGKCILSCPTGTIAEKQKGYRIQLGGKLGRHPQLARELSGIYTEDEVLDIVQFCIGFYKKHSTAGKRFAEILTDSVFERIERIFAKKEP